MRLVLFFVLGLLLQGCGLGMLMAGSGASKAGTAQVMSAYTEYVISMEKINLEREKAKMERRPILSKREWIGGEERDVVEAQEAELDNWGDHVRRPID